MSNLSEYVVWDNMSNMSVGGNVTPGTGRGMMIMETPAAWGFWVKFIATPIIVFVGIVGNTLSLIVMKSKSLRHKSYSHYLSALAVFDTVTLILRQISIIDEYLVIYRQTSGIFYTEMGCKTFKFIEPVAYLMSSWLVVLMAVERVIAVCFPFKKVVLRKQSGAAAAICVLLLLVCASQAFRIPMISLITRNSELQINICASTTDYQIIYTSLDVYFYQVTLVFAFPVTTVLACNSSVLYQIFKVRREMKQKEKNNRYNRVVKKKHRTTCMLLIVSFTYIATLLPLFTLTVFMDATLKLGTDRQHKYRMYILLWPFIELCVAISLINYAVNFFIYVLSGKRFRFELRKVFNKDRKPPRRSFTATARSTREEFIRL